jgi:hypothetical protein
MRTVGMVAVVPAPHRVPAERAVLPAARAARAARPRVPAVHRQEREERRQKLAVRRAEGIHRVVVAAQRRPPPTMVGVRVV